MKYLIPILLLIGCGPLTDQEKSKLAYERRVKQRKQEKEEAREVNQLKVKIIKLHRKLQYLHRRDREHESALKLCYQEIDTTRLTLEEDCNEQMKKFGKPSISDEVMGCNE